MKQSSVSRSKRKSEKPEKPYPGFPLYSHATKRWAKRIRGKIHYFGPWNNPEAALEKFNHEWPYLSEGRTPPPVREDGLTVADLCNHFLTAKKESVQMRTCSIHFQELLRRLQTDYCSAWKGATCRRFAGRRFPEAQTLFCKDAWPTTSTNGCHIHEGYFQIRL